MFRQSSLSLISTAIFATFPILANSAPLSIFANSSTGNKFVEVQPNEEIQNIYVNGNWDDIKAEVVGQSINVNHTNSSSQAVVAQYQGIIKIGDDETEEVNISDSADGKSTVLAQSTSLITIDANTIQITGNETKAVSAEGSGKINIGSDRTSLVDVSSAEYALYSTVGDIDISGNIVKLAGNTSAIFNSDGGNFSINGRHITVSSTTSEAISFGKGGSLTIGDENTEDVNIYTKSGSAGIFLVSKADDNGTAGASAAINGKNVNITASMQNGVGIWLQNGTQTAERPEDATSLKINAENLKISASQAILAYSNAGLDISGNTEISSREAAIVARGNAVVNVNTQCSTCTTKINGDIAFMTTATPDKPDNSGNLINASVNLNLSGLESVWNGRAYQIFMNDSDEMTEHVELDNGNEYHGNVTDFKVALRNGAQWNVSGNSFVNNVEVDDGASVNIPAVQEEADQATEFNIESLALNNGTLNIANVRSTVTAETVSGSGEILLRVTADEDGELQAGTFSATNGSNAKIAVNLTGVDADDFENAESAIKFIDSKVSVNEADVSKYVQEGDINGAIVEADGVLHQSDNTKLEAFKGVNASALVQWRNQINHLTKRLGDIRQHPNGIGAWARVYGGEYKWGHGNDVDMTSTSVQVGGDGRIGDWIVGGAFSYTDSSFDLNNGDGDGDMYSLAVYGTRMFDSGAYVDLVARYGYIKNDLQVKNMDVDFDSNAFSVSVESGHQFKFMERAYVEPQVEVTYGYAQGDDAKASNGVKIDQDDYQNLVTRVGFRTGFDFPEDAGTIYAHVSYSYDFLGDADGTASKDGIRASLDQDLGGGWVTYGIGGQFKISESAFAYADLERSTGGDVENPYAFNVGFRYVF